MNFKKIAIFFLINIFVYILYAQNNPKIKIYNYWKEEFPYEKDKIYSLLYGKFNDFYFYFSDNDSVIAFYYTPNGIKNLINTAGMSFKKKLNFLNQYLSYKKIEYYQDFMDVLYLLHFVSGGKNFLYNASKIPLTTYWDIRGSIEYYSEESNPYINEIIEKKNEKLNCYYEVKPFHFKIKNDTLCLNYDYFNLTKLENWNVKIFKDSIKEVSIREKNCSDKLFKMMKKYNELDLISILNGKFNDLYYYETDDDDLYLLYFDIDKKVHTIHWNHPKQTNKNKIKFLNNYFKIKRINIPEDIYSIIYLANLIIINDESSSGMRPTIEQIVSYHDIRDLVEMELKYGNKNKINAIIKKILPQIRSLKIKEKKDGLHCEYYVTKDGILYKMRVIITKNKTLKINYRKKVEISKVYRVD